ncbi:MAG: hypothetical protein JNL32_00285 [Candidatus Kapabacteria bacterium]|nr:hypothetical protein [Candidatus Kapabacteria bacterium]
MDYTHIKDVAIIIGSLVALFTFINGIIEYGRQGRQKRADQFVIIRRRLKENETFKHLTDMALRNDPALADVLPADKRDLLGLFEEAALMMNSGLIRKEVAHYMFGSYVIACYESEYFWVNLNRTELYWQLFNDFAMQMQHIENHFKYKRSMMRF